MQCGGLSCGDACETQNYSMCTRATAHVAVVMRKSCTLGLHSDAYMERFFLANTRPWNSPLKWFRQVEVVWTSQNVLTLIGKWWYTHTPLTIGNVEPLAPLMFLLSDQCWNRINNCRHFLLSWLHLSIVWFVTFSLALSITGGEESGSFHLPKAETESGLDETGPLTAGLCQTSASRQRQGWPCPWTLGDWTLAHVSFCSVRQRFGLSRTLCGGRIAPDLSALSTDGSWALRGLEL